MSKVVISTTTVADELAFEALPVEVQELAKRVLAGETFTRQDMEEAYKAGFEDACEDYEVIPPTFREHYATDYVDYER